jgi:hypothetical protein
LKKAGFWTAVGELRTSAAESDNDSFIRLWASKCPLVVAAWGAHGNFGDRDFVVANMLSRSGIKLLCLETTARGHPRHPLYVPSGTPLKTYRWGLGR